VAETAPREGGVRDWIVTLPGSWQTLRVSMVGDTVNDALYPGPRQRRAGHRRGLSTPAVEGQGLIAG
jgi:hypothetical protein